MSFARTLLKSIPGVRLSREIARRWMDKLRGDPDSFLEHARGVIHVGANLGQERDAYAARGLNVLWIEPIPELFKRLTLLIEPFPNQKALCELITDTDGQEHILHISNNGGVSSSIFELAEHKRFFPEICYTNAITLNSVRLSTLVRRENIDMSAYDALVMDTQGSEMLVLKGATEILSHFRFIKTEVADFESYKGCCRLIEMDEFFKNCGYHRVATRPFAHKAGIGSYYDVLYAARQ
jgi:FkbM family methyltransferase